jgi:2-polyprenyl-3-methyl-5-hydroxy-6-metoxy-1,4-benzoquinol methylase
VNVTHDLDGAEQRVLAEVVDFAGKRVLEIGCGDGRLTWTFAPQASFVLAIDADDEEIAIALRERPRELAGKVELRAESAVELDVAPASFDLAFLSWSL